MIPTIELNNIISEYDKENLGHYFYSKAVFFALKNEFGKSYELFKYGFDISTCECVIGVYLVSCERPLENIFNDITVDHIPHHEYHFVKAFILSFNSDEKSLYLALDAIEKYISILDDEYGHYVKGKVLLGLDKFHESSDSFQRALIASKNQRTLYRNGRLSEEHLERTGLEHLYNSFIINPSSSCCAQALKSAANKHGIYLSGDENHENIILKEFNNPEISTSNFKSTYHKYCSSLFESRNEEGIITLKGFIQTIQNNSTLFVTKHVENHDDYDDNYGNTYDEYNGSYAQDEMGYSDDAISDAFEGDPDNYWNID